MTKGCLSFIHTTLSQSKYTSHHRVSNILNYYHWHWKLFQLSLCTYESYFSHFLIVSSLFWIGLFTNPLSKTENTKIFQKVSLSPVCKSVYCEVSLCLKQLGTTFQFILFWKQRERDVIRLPAGDYLKVEPCCNLWISAHLPAQSMAWLGARGVMSSCKWFDH